MTEHFLLNPPLLPNQVNNSSEKLKPIQEEKKVNYKLIKSMNYNIDLVNDLPEMSEELYFERPAAVSFKKCRNAFEIC